MEIGRPNNFSLSLPVGKLYDKQHKIHGAILGNRLTLARSVQNSVL